MSELDDLVNEDTRTASKMLSEARQALGLSQEEVAQELFLIPGYIRLIDSDQIDQIDKQAFVRGYLRSYAKLVNLDGDDMVARFEKTQTATPQRIEIRGVTQEKVGSTNFTGPVIQTGIMGLVGLVVVVGIVWFLVSSEDETATQPTVATSVKPSSAAPATLEQPASDPVSEIDQTPAALIDAADDTDDIDGIDVTELSAQVSDQAEQVADTAAETTESPLSSERALIATDNTERAELTEPTAVEEVATAPTESVLVDRNDGVIRVDAGGSDELRFSFSDECWIEIEDAEGTAIYGDLNRSGDELIVTGIAPFEVLFGKAPAVTMVFNGEAFDLEPHTTSVDTAKVRVP